MYSYLTTITADYDYTLNVIPQNGITTAGRKNQIVHSFEDGSDAVVGVSDTSIFDVDLEWTYISDTDRSTIFDLYHDPLKANGSAMSFYWRHPVSNKEYTVRFLSSLKTVYKPGLLIGIDVVKLRILGNAPA